MYKLQKSQRTNEVNFVEKTEGNIKLCIPFDPANTDYQAFLKYQAEGGVVLPADPLPAENA
jgi:hypothetical protein